MTNKDITDPAKDLQAVWFNKGQMLLKPFIKKWLRDKIKRKRRGREGERERGREAGGHTSEIIRHACNDTFI